GKIPTHPPEFDQGETEGTDRIAKVMSGCGENSVDYYHKKLGKIMWNKCGMSRNEKGLREAIEEIAVLREGFWKNVKVPGTANSM
ncbi:fumarate reductase/succinate dehydrogenase flavoprotein subunit, partial [Aquimarina celericrescens]|nr:fumarate reductase/succinate dehydrogenase flavoprotein subunit [Aquimarina celericrescens]